MNIKGVLNTKGGWTPLVLRLGLAVAIFPHGAQKVLGWFGGGGFSNTMQYFSSPDGMALPVAIAFLAIMAEFLGPLLLATGFATRIGAFAIGCNMVAAIAMVHGKNGFFMNWHNNPGAMEGFEYHILALAIALGLIIAGGGRLSIDRALTKTS
ncbi:MAG: DoxX family protein [Kiritimatiellae bacterium]|nr:DoxX family protein [Kiritimatiellia bacterium]